MELIFDQTRLPRTMTRSEWKECDRWRRVTSRKLREEAQHRIAMMVTFGTSHPELMEGFIDRVINPSLLLGPYQA